MQGSNFKSMGEKQCQQKQQSRSLGVSRALAGNGKNKADRTDLKD
jgi:hypothetical protein